MFSFLKKFGKQGRRKGVLKRTLIWDPESSGSNPSLTACRAIGQVSQLGIPHRQPQSFTFSNKASWQNS